MNCIRENEARVSEFVEKKSVCMMAEAGSINIFRVLSVCGSVQEHDKLRLNRVDCSLLGVSLSSA